jgi:hypothetical protein
MSIPTAEVVAQATGYPILRVPIRPEVARLCTSDSKFLAALHDFFAHLKDKRHTSPQHMTSDESAWLKEYERSTTPVIVPVHCAHRSEEAFIVGIHARKLKEKEDLLQFRLPPGQQMTPEQKAEFSTWNEERKAAYSRRLTKDDLSSNQKFSNRHRTADKQVSTHCPA